MALSFFKTLFVSISRQMQVDNNDYHRYFLVFNDKCEGKKKGECVKNKYRSVIGTARDTFLKY